MTHITQGLGLLLFQGDHFFQIRPERGEIAFPPGILPGQLAKDGGSGEFLHKRLGQFDLFIALPF